MKKILLFSLLLLSFKNFAQGITVNPNAYTTSQLVNTVLVKNSCLAQVSNISKSTGNDFGYAAGNGIGYFQNTNPNFPIQSGVVLTSGNAVAAQGPNTNTSSFNAPAWGGDADLETYVPINSHNATSLEFDFIAATSMFSVDFLFASEEYGTYQCESNDAFVFLLTNLNTGVTTNVAVVPNTTQPVSVANIRNILYNSECPSVNPSYFGLFNGGGSAGAAAVNYEGQTVLMNASAVLVPNTPYHIKIVIADDGGTNGTDGEFDSAVFFPEGSFNLGQNVLGPDLTIANGTALCNGDTYTIDTELDGPEYQLAWTRNGSPITAGSVIAITQPGTYQLTVTRGHINCTVTQEVVIEYGSPISAESPIDLFACEDASGIYSYDLTINTPIVKEGLNPATVVSYHASQSDAENNVSALASPYNSAGNQTIWVRVKSHNSTCYVVMPFELLTSPAPVVNQPEDLVLCETEEGVATAIFNLTEQNSAILEALPDNDVTILYFTSMEDAVAGTPVIDSPAGYTGGNQTVYARIQRNFDENCYSITTFDLVVTPLPVMPEVDDVSECDSYTLPSLSTGNYFTAPNGTGTPLATGDVLTESQTVYIYTETTGSPVCSNQTSFEVAIITAATAPSDVIACEGYELPQLPAGQFYYNAPGGTGGEIPAGTVITATQTIYFYIPAAAECTQNNNFTVTITDTPVVTELDDVNTCEPYILPALPNGENYYTAPNGGGTQLAEGAEITTTQTIYIYTSDADNPDCTAESSFTVTAAIIAVTAPADIVRCGTYNLPALSNGNYYTGPGGTGTQLASGTGITTSQTIYVYQQSSVLPECSDEESFTVTINPLPALASIPSVVACGSYILPDTLPDYANYYTGSNGSGTLLAPGTEITATQTIYAFTDPNEFGCTRQRSFTVTIINAEAENPGDQNVCGSYTLPGLPAGNYYTQPGGTGTQLAVGTVINTSQTIYVYVQTNTTPPCIAESSFTVTVTPNPVIASIPNVIACNSYTLPALAVGNYYTGSQGTGTMLPAGTQITATQTIYAFAQTGGTPNCTRQRSFTVTIINGSIAPANVTECGSYTLPALPIGNYFTAPAGGGAPILAGTEITSTQTIYTYVAVTSGTNCTNNNSFTVTIIDAPVIDDPQNVSSCSGYTLPLLLNGNYYTGQGGTGTMLPAGTLIDDPGVTTLYIFAMDPDFPECSSENSFTVTINDIDVEPIDDVLVCTGYELPELSVGNYYTQPDGNGSMLNAGDVIDSDQTIYVYAETNTTPICSDEESFTVTIKPDPVIDTPDNVGVCGDYILPALTNGNYYTGSGGTGTQLFAGDVVTFTQDIYVYAETGGVPNCTAEHVFTVFINPEPPANVTACGSYTLPELSVGNYYTAPAGMGTQLFAGDEITATQDIYVYIDMNMQPNCTDDNFFTVTVNQYPVLDDVQDITACDVYTLPALTVGNYYTGPGGTGDFIAQGSEITASGTTTIYLYAETGTMPNCTSESSFDITIFQTPVVDARSTVEICNSYTLDPLIVGSYYGLQGGPDAPGQVPYFAGDVITESLTMYIFADNPDNPECFAENSFEIEISSIVADNPEPVSVCDSYILPELNVGDYYTLSGGPDTPGQAMLNAGDVITASQALYVYAELGGRLNCNDENPFEITVFETPVVDDTQDDIAVCFEYVLPQLAVGNYYTASGGNGTQLNEGSVITSSQTVYIYAETGNDFITCFDEHSYVVTVYSIEVPQVNDIFACETYTLPALPTGNYYTQPAGQGTVIPEGTVITNTQTIYIYGETNTDPVCTAESNFTVTIVTTPTAAVPSGLSVCSSNDEGFGVFNLHPALQEIIGNQQNVVATVHETLDGATFGENESGSINAYSNIFPFSQTLYIRVSSTLAENCYTIVELQLTVNPNPDAVTPADYSVCDNGEFDTDGIGVFDLTTVNEEVLGDLDETLYTVSYHTTLTQAQLGQGAIQNPMAYQSPTATLYVRVTNNTTGCYDIVELQLIVNPLPVANQPTPYTLCDTETPGDAVETFDLTTKIPEIITVNGQLQQGINVTFHTSFDDAQAGQDAIQNPETYQNTPSVQTLFVRVTIEATGCYRIVLLDVRVEAVPSLFPESLDPELTHRCDEDGNGVAFFDLEALIEDLINNEPNLEVTFHETYQNAIQGTPAIPNTTGYPNPTPFEHVIWVRVVNTLTGCASAEPYALTLTVTASPQVPDLEDITLCDDTDNNGQDNQALFDLTQQDEVIYAGEGIGEDHIIHYFISEDFAREGAPRITTPQAYYGTHGQVIWVRVEDPESGCFGISSFQLLLNQPLAITMPSVLSLCETDPDTNDATEVFDLTVKNNEILGPFGVGMGHTVEYFLSEEDRDNGNPIPNPEAFTNTENAQTLFVLVTTPEGCRSYTTLTIKVLPLPTPNMNPEPLALCDDTNSPDGEEEFDLTLAQDDIRDNDTSVVLTYFETQEDAENNQNPIPDPTAYNSGNASVWVRVEANTGNPDDTVCYKVVELQLIVNPLPLIGDNGTIAPFEQCESNTDGFSEFILNQHTPAILAGIDPDSYGDYTVRFYLTQAHAQAGQPILPNQYTNTTAEQQEIWVRVTHIATGCVAIGSFDLLVGEQAIANPVDDMIVCDTEGDNDGFYTFDLTPAEAQVLGSQDEAIHDISFHTSQADAQSGANPIADPSAYQNEEAGVQEIWVRIINNTTVNGCAGVTSFTLYVEELPEPVLTPGNLCRDFNTGVLLSGYLLDSQLDNDTHTFEWFFNGVAIPGATESTYLAEQVGSYSVRATSNLGGCVSEISAPVTVGLSSPASPIGRGYTVSNAFSQSQTITVTVAGHGEYQYSLDGGPWQESPVFTNVAPGPHVVTVRDVSSDNPCDDLVLGGVSVIDYPRFFTPNGDGYNDTWNIIGLGDQASSARIYIFDRYGKLMKQLSASEDSEGWDGTFNGVPVPATDYWFTVTYEENGVTREFKAHFSLKR